MCYTVCSVFPSTQRVQLDGANHVKRRLHQIHVRRARLREQPVYEQYSDDKSYKLEIHQRADGLYEVRARRKITDEYMGNDWFEYTNLHDMMHLTDTLQSALQIGGELLRNLI